MGRKNQELLEIREEYFEAVIKDQKELDRLIEEIERREKGLLNKLQLKCNHPLIAQAPMEKGDGFWTNDEPSFRVCYVCGTLEEEPKKGGYQTLTQRPTLKVTRKEGYRLRSPSRVLPKELR